MSLRILALVAAVSLLSAACGDDSSDLDAAAELATSDDSTTGQEADDSDEPVDDDSDGDADPVDDADGDTPEGETGNDKDGSDAEPESAAKEGSEALAEFFDDGGISQQSEECMIDALLDDGDLLAAILDAGPDPELSDLAESDQVAAIEIGLGCVTQQELEDEFAGTFSSGPMDDALADEAVSCLAGRFLDESDPDRSDLLLGFVAVGEDRVPAGPQRAAIVDAMADCISGDLFVSAMTSGLADDPLLGEALDVGCVDATIADGEYVKTLLDLTLESPDLEFEELPPDDQASIVLPLFGCLDFGGFLAASAAESGVELSSDTIDCINEALDPDLLVSAFTGDAADAETAFVGAVLPCLSAEELLALG